jgi:hypothetical protein
MMDDSSDTLEKITAEFGNFQKTVEELATLKRVAADLKSFRKMIRLRRYD